jgi:hypothetical protein
MDRMKVARELVLAARELVGMEFRTQDALNKYLKDHPKADKSKHSVKKQTEKPAGKAPGGEAAVHPKVTPLARSLGKVKKVMQAHGLDEESDELGEMMGFKKTLGQRVPESQRGQYYVRNEAKLKSDFIRNMSPANYDSPEAFKAAKERMQKMPAGDFGKLLAAISDEEETK